tara:strand:- start:11381 stop:11599 length:219 start_codon:yes stop_codon:yes gene_type:complete
MKPIKLSTEWQLGNLAMILNILSVLLIIMTALIGFEEGTPINSIFCWLIGVYSVTIVVLFHYWADKFNYIEG